MGEYKHLGCPQYKFWFQLLKAKESFQGKILSKVVCATLYMSVKSLNSLMRILIDSPPMNEIDFQRSFKKWSTANARRILNISPMFTKFKFISAYAFVLN